MINILTSIRMSDTVKDYHTLVSCGTRFYVVHDHILNGFANQSMLFKRRITNIHSPLICDNSEYFALPIYLFEEVKRQDGKVVSSSSIGREYFKHQRNSHRRTYQNPNLKVSYERKICAYCCSHNCQNIDTIKIKKPNRVVHVHDNPSYSRNDMNTRVGYNPNYFDGGHTGHTGYVSRAAYDTPGYSHNHKSIFRPQTTFIPADEPPPSYQYTNNDYRSSEMNDIDQMLLEKAIAESLMNSDTPAMDSKSKYINSPRYGRVLRENCPDDEPDLNEYLGIKKLEKTTEIKQYNSLDERIESLKNDIETYKIKCKITMDMDQSGIYKYNITTTEDDINSDEATTCSVCLDDILISDIDNKIDGKYEHVSVCKCDGTMGLMHRNCYIESIKNEFVRCTLCHTNYYKPDEIDKITEQVLDKYRKRKSEPPETKVKQPILDENKNESKGPKTKMKQPVLRQYKTKIKSKPMDNIMNRSTTKFKTSSEDIFYNMKSTFV